MQVSYRITQTKAHCLHFTFQKCFVRNVEIICVKNNKATVTRRIEGDYVAAVNCLWHQLVPPGTIISSLVVSTGNAYRLGKNQTYVARWRSWWPVAWDGNYSLIERKRRPALGPRNSEFLIIACPLASRSNRTTKSTIRPVSKNCWEKEQWSLGRGGEPYPALIGYLYMGLTFPR